MRPSRPHLPCDILQYLSKNRTFLTNLMLAWLTSLLGLVLETNSHFFIFDFFPFPSSIRSSFQLTQHLFNQATTYSIDHPQLQFYSSEVLYHSHS